MTDTAKKDQLRELVGYFFESNPFNRHIGLKKEMMDIDTNTMTLEMRDELVGNFAYHTLHGGVVATLLDLMGGYLVTLSVFNKTKEQTLAKQIERISKIGTIDLRIDYLLPGKGNCFKITGQLMRAGSKIAVTRTEIHNEEGRLIASGIGTYTTGWI